MKVRFSKLASYKLDKLSEYLIKQWSAKSNRRFLQKLDSQIQIIKSNPRSFPESQVRPGLRKCIVTKQTSILYEIQNESIFVITIIDTRQNQEKIKEEISKHFG